MSGRQMTAYLQRSFTGSLYHLGGFITNFVLEMGTVIVFLCGAFRSCFHPPYRIKETIYHIEFVGYQSVKIIILTGLFTGLVVGFQSWVGLSIVGAESLIGPTAGLGLFRELGPVLTGLIISARAGGAMAARLGTMTVTEQMDALEVMGISIKNYLIAPRIGRFNSGQPYSFFFILCSSHVG